MRSFRCHGCGDKSCTWLKGPEVYGKDGWSLIVRAILPCANGAEDGLVLIDLL